MTSNYALLQARSRQHHDQPFPVLKNLMACMGSRSKICLEYSEQRSAAVNHDGPKLAEPGKKGDQQKQAQLSTSQNTPVSSQHEGYSKCSFGTRNYQCTLGLSRRANIPDAPLPRTLSLFFSQNCILSAKGLLSACEKTKRMPSFGAGLGNVPLKGLVIEKSVQPFSSDI